MSTLILHGWGGSDYPHWQSHLASQIAQEYGTVSFPLLDNCHFPSKNRWMRQVKQILQEFRPDTVVCHSLANTLWFWLSDEGEIDRVKRLIMVSPPSRYTKEETIKTFFPSPIPNNLYADEVDMILSDDDPYITIDEAQEISQRYDIPMKILKNAGHINADSGYGRWSYIEDLVIGDRYDT